jgi:antirestriction protein ArdC
MKATQVYESVTASIVAQLESGADLGQWKAPWHGSHGMPTNAATGKAYRRHTARVGVRPATWALWSCSVRV